MLRRAVKMSRGNSDHLPFFQQLRIFCIRLQMAENREDAQHSARYPPMKNGLC